MTFLNVLYSSTNTQRKSGRASSSQKEDFEALYAVACDPLIWEQHPSSDRYKEEVFREFFRQAMESCGAFLVRDTKSGEAIGSSRFAYYNEAESQIEIGWSFLARSYWGGKYNGEMKRLMLEHAFQFVDSVVFFVGVGNIRSQGAMEKISGVQIKSTNDENGRPHFVYQITRSAFEERKNE